MKILVPIKRVPDTDQKIAATADGAKVAIDHIPFVINPFDAIALEEAVRISERLGGAAEVVAVGIGEAEYEQQLRTALAMGATRGICVRCSRPLDPWNVARLLEAVVVREQPDLVIMGKQAVDDDCNQSGQMLAALLGWPQAAFISKIAVSDDHFDITREVDGGLENLTIKRPAVVTTDLRLNEPRYVTLPNIMKAKKKPLENIKAETLGIDIAPRLTTLRMKEPAARGAGVKVADAAELINKLKNEAKVI